MMLFTYKKGSKPHNDWFFKVIRILPVKFTMYSASFAKVMGALELITLSLISDHIDLHTIGHSSKRLWDGAV